MAQSLPLREGDRGQLVGRVQKWLGVVGYDIVSDGDFGGITDAAVRDFQDDNGLLVDGIVGKTTYGVLKVKAGAIEVKEASSFSLVGKQDGIITDYRLSKSQYLQQKHKKTQIYIHFTAGAPSAKNVISGWDRNAPRIATAYVIDGKSGEAYEAFLPEYYGYHLGVKGSNGRLDKASIGIEICAWGYLTEKNGKYYNYVNKEVSEDRVYKLDKPFRGYKYFHAYSEAQLNTLETLLETLIEEFNINVQPYFDYDWFEYKQDVIDNTTPGIWNHVTVRKSGKWDSYPDHRLLEIMNRLSKKYNPDV